VRPIVAHREDWMPDTATDAHGVLNITESAVRRVAALIEQEGGPDMMLRVSVSGGGCSGFQYGFSFDDSRNGDDLLFERGGVRVVVDEISLELLNGAEIDFVEDLAGSAFAIRNPNATASCGCGNSFAV